MPWYKTDVEGKVMWKNEDGQRVSDPSVIDSVNSHHSSCSCSGHSSKQDEVWTFIIIAFFMGFMFGIIVCSGINKLDKNPSRVIESIKK